MLQPSPQIVITSPAEGRERYCNHHVGLFVTCRNLRFWHVYSISRLCVCLSVCSPSRGHNFDSIAIKIGLRDPLGSRKIPIENQWKRSKVKVKVIKRSKITFWAITWERMVVKGRGFLLNILEVNAHLASHWLFSLWRHVFPQNDVKNWWKYIFFAKYILNCHKWNLTCACAVGT